jgi:RNA polymerase sigma-70 factor (ECF subfamily)
MATERRGSRTARASAGDEALVQAVYREHGRAMLAYATRLLNDRAAAEDVVQEALIRAWRHPEVLTNGKGSIRGWLLTVVRNLVTDRQRARAARPAEVAETAATGDLSAVVRDHADQVVASVTVLEALEGLSDDHRGVLDQLYFQGRSLGETATALGIPTGTVKSRTYYALRALRRALNRDDVLNVMGEGGATA